MGETIDQQLLTKTRQKSAYLRHLANNPGNITAALKEAGLPVAYLREAEVWDETVLVRRQIRLALDEAGASAPFIAQKLMDLANHKNPGIALQAVKFIAKLRGYDEPEPTQTARRVPRDQQEQDQRQRIVELLNLSHYPVVGQYIDSPSLAPLEAPPGDSPGTGEATVPGGGGGGAEDFSEGEGGESGQCGEASGGVGSTFGDGGEVEEEITIEIEGD